MEIPQQQITLDGLIARKASLEARAEEVEQEIGQLEGAKSEALQAREEILELVSKGKDLRQMSDEESQIEDEVFDVLERYAKSKKIAGEAEETIIEEKERKKASLGESREKKDAKKSERTAHAEKTRNTYSRLRDMEKALGFSLGQDGPARGRILLHGDAHLIEELFTQEIAHRQDELTSLSEGMRGIEAAIEEERARLKALEEQRDSYEMVVQLLEMNREQLASLNLDLPVDEWRKGIRGRKLQVAFDGETEAFSMAGRRFERILEHVEKAQAYHATLNREHSGKIPEDETAPFVEELPAEILPAASGEEVFPDSELFDARMLGTDTPPSSPFATRSIDFDLAADYEPESIGEITVQETWESWNIGETSSLKFTPATSGPDTKSIVGIFQVALERNGENLTFEAPGSVTQNDDSSFLISIDVSRASASAPGPITRKWDGDFSMKIGADSDLIFQAGLVPKPGGGYLLKAGVIRTETPMTPGEHEGHVTRISEEIWQMYSDRRNAEEKKKERPEVFREFINILSEYYIPRIVDTPRAQEEDDEIIKYPPNRANKSVSYTSLRECIDLPKTAPVGEVRTILGRVLMSMSLRLSQSIRTEMQGGVAFLVRVLHRFGIPGTLNLVEREQFISIDPITGDLVPKREASHIKIILSGDGEHVTSMEDASTENIEYQVFSKLSTLSVSARKKVDVTGLHLSELDIPSAISLDGISSSGKTLQKLTLGAETQREDILLADFPILVSLSPVAGVSDELRQYYSSTSGNLPASLEGVALQRFSDASGSNIKHNDLVYRRDCTLDLSDSAKQKIKRGKEKKQMTDKWASWEIESSPSCSFTPTSVDSTNADIIRGDFHASVESDGKKQSKYISGSVTQIVASSFIISCDDDVFNVQLVKVPGSDKNRLSATLKNPDEEAENLPDGKERLFQPRILGRTRYVYDNGSTYDVSPGAPDLEIGASYFRLACGALVCASCDVGGKWNVEGKKNEDRFLIRPKDDFLVVIDGTGGHAAGDEAAEIAAQGFLSAENKQDSGVDVLDVRSSLKPAISALREKCKKRNPDAWAPDAVASSLQIFPNPDGHSFRLQIGHAGDCRIMILSQDGETILFTSKDDGVGRYVTNGIFGDGVEGPHWLEDDFLKNVPAGSRILLMSDGITKCAVDDNDVIRRLVGKKSQNEAMRDLNTFTLDVMKGESKLSDNRSVAIIDLPAPGKPKSKIPDMAAMEYKYPTPKELAHCTAADIPTKIDPGAIPIAQAIWAALKNRDHDAIRAGGEIVLQVGNYSVILEESPNIRSTMISLEDECVLSSKTIEEIKKDFPSCLDILGMALVYVWKCFDETAVPEGIKLLSPSARRPGSGRQPETPRIITEPTTPPKGTDLSGLRPPAPKPRGVASPKPTPRGQPSSTVHEEPGFMGRARDFLGLSPAKKVETKATDRPAIIEFIFSSECKQLQSNAQILVSELLRLARGNTAKTKEINDGKAAIEAQFQILDSLRNAITKMGNTVQWGLRTNGSIFAQQCTNAKGLIDDHIAALENMRDDLSPK